METQLEKIMRILNVSEEEAQEVIKADKAIDRGERMEFDLSHEQEKLAKKYARADRTKDAAKPTNTRKPDEEKEAIIACISTFLGENCELSPENVLIANKNNEISFRIGENEYSLKLTKHRKSKNGG